MKNIRDKLFIKIELMKIWKTSSMYGSKTLNYSSVFSAPKLIIFAGQDPKLGLLIPVFCVFLSFFPILRYSFFSLKSTSTTLFSFNRFFSSAGSLYYKSKNRLQFMCRFSVFHYLKDLHRIAFVVLITKSVRDG